MRSRSPLKVSLKSTRLNIEGSLVDEVAAGWRKIGVVVSRPGSLSDDVKAAVVAAGRQGDAVFAMEVDAYSW